MTEYEPGVCNIGKAEQRKRYGLGLTGAAITVLLTGFIFTGVVEPIGLVGVAIASFAMFEGLLQGYFNFCAGFASRGVYDVSEEGSEREKVEDDSARKKDKVRGLQIHMYSLTGALVLTAFLVLGLMI